MFSLYTHWKQLDTWCNLGSDWSHITVHRFFFFFFFFFDLAILLLCDNAAESRAHFENSPCSVVKDTQHSDI